VLLVVVGWAGVVFGGWVTGATGADVVCVGVGAGVGLEVVVSAAPPLVELEADVEVVAW
jgi:hypothetical protein